MIIRQNVLDHPNTHKILIVVPKHLVGQWREELCEKFHLDEYLDERIIVMPSNNFVSIKEFGEEANMLVIDEAHHIASFAESKNEEERNLFELIRNIANNTEKLLLLSATPVLHNEMGFLAMLHLLDPAIYKLEGIESFRERVNKRQEIAEIYHNFNKESSGYFLKDYSTELQEYFPQDNRLKELLGRLEPLLEFEISEDNPQRVRLIHSVRSHISETYKLHRRLLRNRRTEDKEDLVTGRSGLISVTFSETIYNEIEELIDEWRIESSLSNVNNPNKGLIELFQIIFEAFISDLNLLSAILLLRLGKLGNYVNNSQFHEIDLSIVTNTPLFETEVGILNKILSLIVSNPSVDEQRLTALTNLLKEKFNESKRIVIFCNFQSTADNLFNNLSQKFSKKTIVRHSTYIDSSSKYESEWSRFKNDPECRILVCDRRGEEGLNLQGGHAIIIHYDIPISPNRLEQRMGRLDRYGYGDAVKSYLLIFKDSHLLSSWITLINDVFQVFDRSIASLQYLIEDEMKKLWKEILFEGRDVIKKKIQEFGGDKGKIEKELVKIKQQDELDAIEIIESEGDEWLDELIDADFAWKDIQDSSNLWIQDRLNFKIQNTDNDKVFRYRYTDQTLTPVTDLIKRFIGVIDPDAPDFNALEPTTFALSYKRQTALNQKVRVARIGEPFIDAMRRYIFWDDRGICFVMWRYRPDVNIDNFAELYFCFDFIVETDTSETRKLICKEYQVSDESIQDSIQRKGDVFYRPFIQTIWLDENLELVNVEDKLRILQEPYNSKLSIDHSRDYNINQDRWALLEDMYDSNSWRETCIAAKKSALKHLYEQANLITLTKTSAKIAREKTFIILDQLKSRIISYKNADISSEKQQLAFEKSFSDALISGILNPSIRIDSVGAVFLSNNIPFGKR